MSPYEDYTTRSAASPGGALRLEEHYQQGERMPARPYLRLVRASDGAEVFLLRDVSLIGEPDFQSGGSLRLTLGYEGRRVPALLDYERQTFRLHPHDYDEPLGNLEERLRREYAPPPLPPGRAGAGRQPSARATAARLFMLLGSLAFVAAGVWIALSGSVRDRWAGLFGALFFGACAAAAFLELIGRD